VKIEITSATGGKYKGTLTIDDDVVATAIHARVGCCVRSLLNQLTLSYGKPDGDIYLEIYGW
jgi:hypothetical protein